MIPQLIFLGLIGLSLGYDLARHGKEKETGKVNVWTSLWAKLIFIGLLWWGGFFDVFKN